MSTFTSTPAGPRSALEDLHALRRELEALGMMRKPTLPVVLHLLTAVAVALAGCFMTWLPLPWYVRVLGVPVAVLGMISVGTNSHTSSHRGASDKNWVNEALTFFGYPVFLGLSATSWWHRHVVVHHPAPNVAGVDGDCDLFPWFALTRDDVEKSTGALRFYFEKLQFWVFPLALLANSFNMQRTGWRHVIRCLRDPKKRTRHHYIDLGCLVLHYVLWFTIPLSLLPWQPVVIGYVARMLLMSYAMYAMLAPGHYPADALRLKGDHRKTDFVLLQTACSVNFEGGWLASATASGLQYQIEHHLFPTMSHVYLPKAAPLVRAYCERHGLPYHSMGWAHVLWRSWAVLKDPPRTVDHLERAA